MNEIRRIRELTGLSMNKFSAKYHIPARTLQDWEYEKAEPAAYLVDLLERAVRKDFDLQDMYVVVSVSNRTDEEWDICRTMSRKDAIDAALAEDERAGKDYRTELRIEYSDAEERGDYNYDLVEFREPIYRAVKIDAEDGSEMEIRSFKASMMILYDIHYMMTNDVALYKGDKLVIYDENDNIIEEYVETED